LFTRGDARSKLEPRRAASGLLASLGPYLPIVQRTAIANQWLFGWYLKAALSKSTAMNAVLRTTFAPTMLSGSPKENVLPSEARATVNVRIHPRDTVDSVVAHLRALFPNDPGSQSKPVQESRKSNCSLIDRIHGISSD